MVFIKLFARAICHKHIYLCFCVSISLDESGQYGSYIFLSALLISFVCLYILYALDQFHMFVVMMLVVTLQIEYMNSSYSIRMMEELGSRPN